jgi:aspartyl-tRNA(Asn)/glutamyl-tRNA(Gln) amidotransferase subunit C
MSNSINIAHLATLARLSLDENARALAERELHNIIDMIDTMQTIDTEGVEPMAHPLDATQRLREDVVTEIVDAATFQATAPSTEDGYYLVPRVVE